MLLIEENKYIKIYKRLRKPGKGKKNKSQARWKKIIITEINEIEKKK